ncbi:MAG: hypothetical protein DDT36_00158 [Firmicutes bacterium]|nr:hypothetical protein [Bacillota bacterium]
MMVFLRGWVQDIVVLLVLTLVVDSALPNGGVKRYVDYAVGLMLLLLLLSPINTFINNELDLSSMLATAEVLGGRRLKILDPLSLQSTWLTYELVLENRVAQISEEHEDVVKAKAEVTLEQAEDSAHFGMPTRVLLKVQLRQGIGAGSREEQQIHSALSERLAGIYGIKPAHMAIEFTR